MTLGTSHCPVRILGDVSLAISFPVLISRILAKGNAGISMTSQGLHLIVFLARYMDLMVQPNITPSNAATWHQWLLHWYNPIAKLYYINAAVAVLISMAYVNARKNAFKSPSTSDCLRDAWKATKNYAVYILPMAFLAYRFYRIPFLTLDSVFPSPFVPPGPSTIPITVDADEAVESGLGHVFGWISSVLEFFSPADLFNMDLIQIMEVFWAFSIYLSAVADIPQYVVYYSYLTGKTSVDWWLMSYMLATTGFRFFYIPHWILRFSHEGFLEPIAFVCAIVQVGAFWMFFVLCFNKVNNKTSSLRRFDEEAQWDEYESGWHSNDEPTSERYPGEWDGLLINAEQRPLRKSSENEKSTPNVVIISAVPSLPTITVIDLDGPPPPLPPSARRPPRLGHGPSRN